MFELLIIVSTLVVPSERGALVVDGEKKKERRSGKANGRGSWGEEGVAERDGGAVRKTGWIDGEEVPCLLFIL